MNTPETTNDVSGESTPKKFVFPRCLDCGGDFTAGHYRVCPAVKAAEDAEDKFLLAVASITCLLFFSVTLLSILLIINNLYVK